MDELGYFLEFVVMALAISIVFRHPLTFIRNRAHTLLARSGYSLFRLGTQPTGFVEGMMFVVRI